MKTCTWIAFLVLASAALAQETQVPLDSAGTLEVITADMARKLGIFENYDGLQTARLYMTTDSAYVLEIEYRPAGRTLKQREALTASQADSLRYDVTRRMRAEMPHGMPDQDGRTAMLVGTTLIGLAYYGWAIPAMTDVSDGRVAVALYMLTSGSSFLVPYLITEHTPVNRAEASAALYGGWRGIPHGFLTYGLLAGNNGTGEGLLASGMAASVGEMIAGYQWAHHVHATPGKISAMAACGDFGAIFGGATGLLLIGHQTEDAEPGFNGDNDRPIEGKVRTFCASTLIGAAGGLVIGNALSNQQIYTKGDGYVLRETGLLGLGTIISIVEIANMNDSGAELLTMAGSAGGILLGHRLTRDVNFSASQGTLIGLSELGGALFGLGLAVLINSDDSAPYWSLATFGAAGGFGLSYHAFARSHAARSHSLLEMQVAPQGMLAYDTTGRSRVIPGFGATVRF